MPSFSMPERRDPRRQTRARQKAGRFQSSRPHDSEGEDPFPARSELWAQEGGQRNCAVLLQSM